MLLAVVIPERAYVPGQGVRNSNHSHAIRELVALELGPQGSEVDVEEKGEVSDMS